MGFLIGVILVDIFWVLFICMFVVIVSALYELFTDAPCESKFSCFMDKISERLGWAMVVMSFVAIFVAGYFDVPLTPSVPGLKNVSAESKEMYPERSEAGQDKTGVKTSSHTRSGNDDVKTKSAGGGNKAGNSKTKNSGHGSMADKIKYAKKHEYTFLFNNKKIKAEDFDYENSDVVVLDDLKLVIGVPK